jgi:LPS sulfotransferase NodH
MQPTRAVVIITQGRSGSTLLHGYLDQLPGVMGFGELFKTGGADARRIARHIADPEPALARLNVLQATDHAAFWRSLQDLVNGAGYRPAAKMFYRTHADDDPLWAEFRTATVLHLVRENILDNVVSRALANRKALWKDTQYDPAYDDGTITIDPKDCDERLSLIRGKLAWARGFYRGCCDYNEISYDDLIDIKEAERALGAALKQPVALRRQATARQRRRPLSELVANYDEVAKYDRNFDLLTQP